MTERRTAAELRSFTLGTFLLDRFRRLVAYERDAELVAARRQALTRVGANVASGIATSGVYVALGVLLAAGTLPLSVAGTAVLAIRTAQASLAQLLYAVNRCYEVGLYFSDYLAFCIQAAALTPEPGGRPAPAKVLAGLYQPDAGLVSWDATPTSGMDPDRLREQIAVIAQDHVNWPLTVAHNITMGRPAEAGALAQAAAVAGADRVIGDLPRGYQTLLDRQFKDGVELSGGQWQRIAVARGFYREAPLLIMDEPTAALDARAEYALFSSFRQHARGRSVLIITHRLASVRQADRVCTTRCPNTRGRRGNASCIRYFRPQAGLADRRPAISAIAVRGSQRCAGMRARRYQVNGHGNLTLGRVPPICDDSVTARSRGSGPRVAVLSRGRRLGEGDPA